MRCVFKVGDVVSFTEKFKHHILSEYFNREHFTIEEVVRANRIITIESIGYTKRRFNDRSEDAYICWHDSLGISHCHWADYFEPIDMSSCDIKDYL
jgi:hypothetical protein